MISPITKPGLWVCMRVTSLFRPSNRPGSPASRPPDHRIRDPAIENPLALAFGAGQLAVAHHHHLRCDHEPVLDDVAHGAARCLSSYFFKSL